MSVIFDSLKTTGVLCRVNVLSLHILFSQNIEIMTKQLERLKIIYTYLKQTSADAKTILEYLKHKNAEISLRQLQRDLTDVEKFFLTANEKLAIKKEGLRKNYKIISSKKKITFEQSTINTWQLMKHSGDIPLLKKRGRDQEAMDKILNSVIILASGKQNLNNSEIIKATNFYTVKKDDAFNMNVDILLKAIRESLYIKIDKIVQDFTGTGINKDKLNVKFAPIAVVYHRGDFFIQGLENKKAVVYEIGQFQNIKLLQVGFNYENYKELVGKELDKRFGITKNINDEVYDIKIEFTSVTGALVSKYFWHHSQHFKKNNGNHIMTMKCGINRELLGWLFQWMYNVRIIEPAVLQEFYDKTFRKMINNVKSKDQLVYDNIFKHAKD